jgi:hypothetical protein
MADLMKVKQALPPLLLKYLEDLEADEKKGLSPEVVEKWKQAALDLTRPHGGRHEVRGPAGYKPGLGT